MPNQFSKQEIVDYSKLGTMFEDNLVISKQAEIFNADPTNMARSGDIIWRPMPYIGVSFDGTDQTSNFQESTQLSVPVTINFYKSSPFAMTSQELRDNLQSGRLQKAAAQKLASDINRSIQDVVCNEGTLFVKRSGVMTGFDDVAQCDALMNEQGVPYPDRWLALSSRDYNSGASNLQVASRSFDNETSTRALRDAMIGRVASFDTLKLDYANQKAAALGGAGLTASTTYTAGGAGNYWLPAATAGAATGQLSNVDNRKAQITLSATTSVVAGDRFTIAGVQAAHMITKQSTGQLRDFVVTRVISSTVLEISPPIINVAGTSQAEKAYGNCVITAQSGTAAIVFRNTALGALNPFAVKGAIELIPGTFDVPTNEGVASMKMSTEHGVQLVVTKFFDGNVMKEKVRVDAFWGVACLNPQMCGVMMFSQP